MQKIKRIGAIILIVILVGLYISTLVFALTENPGTMRMFAVSIAATVVLPVLLYVYQMIFRAFSKKEEVREIFPDMPDTAVSPDADEDASSDSEEDDN